MYWFPRVELGIHMSSHKHHVTCTGKEMEVSVTLSLHISDYIQAG